MLCAKEIQVGVQAREKAPHSRAGLAFVIRCWETSHTGPMESEAKRSICRADSALRDRVVGAVAEGGEKKVVDIWGRGVRRERAQMSGENSVGFRTDIRRRFRALGKALLGPIPSGGHSPRRSLGGVYFRITLSANAFRNAHVERYMHRSTSRAEDRSPFIGRYGFGDAPRTAGSAEHFRRSPRSLER